jgi:hypothetical protein
MHVRVLALKYRHELNCQDEIHKFISKRRIISHMHRSILRRIWLHLVAHSFCVWGGGVQLFSIYHYFGFPKFSASTLLKRHHLSKCTSGASEMVLQKFYFHINSFIHLCTVIEIQSCLFITVYYSILTFALRRYPYLQNNICSNHDHFYVWL